METNELTKPDSFIETELQRFEKIITKEQLITMADSVKDLVIKDTEDKAGLKAVIEGRKKLKAQRVIIEKEAKNIRESAVRFQKAVIQRESEYVSLLEPTEDILAGREDWYYTEKARLDALKEKQESDRIQAMIDKLNAVRHAVDFHELKALTDVQFESLLAEATIKYNTDLKAEQDEQQRQYELRLQEETRLAQAQKEQEERERKFKEEQEKVRIENERIQKIQAEKQREMDAHNERIQKEQEAKQKQIDEQQSRIEKENNALFEKKRSARIKQLLDLGLKFDGTSFIFETPAIYINFHHSDILSFDDTKWDTEYNKAQTTITEYNIEFKKTQEKEEEERKKRIEAERKKREKEEKEQMLLYGEDTDRFAFHMGNLERNYIHGGGISGHMKSKKAKQVAAEADYLIRQAYDMCKANMGDKNRTAVPVIGDKVDD